MKKPNINLYKLSRTFSHEITSSVKNENILDNSSFRKMYSNNIYHKISIRNSIYSSKNKNHNSYQSHQFIKTNLENFNNISNNLKYNDDYNNIYNNPRIEYKNDTSMNKILMV